MTVVELLKVSAGYLDKHGADSPRLDAEVLLAHALDLRRLDLYLQFDRALTESELSAYRSLIGRRAKGEPVAYLVGHKEFMGLDFTVTPDVLVPNPDTEVLVQRAVAIAREADRPVRVADVGTGSGCIAIATAHYAPNAEVWASDISPAALAVAERNVSAHELDGRVHLVCGDLMEPLSGRFDIVCANLPYLSRSVRVPLEVLAQPPRALYADGGGAELVSRLIAESPAHLAADGRVLAELDPSIFAALSATAGASFRSQRVHRDLGGHERVLEIWSFTPTGSEPEA
ncbi:MAG TPA: peptide chain release factor N(5)-glutamine methyltransferase [Candidatus Dormibacteraeota bacterium]|nr:peptide chain release factor N(5)-glutamine methyltransferase [Candidatus Dormibacteraeota bacterium]